MFINKPALPNCVLCILCIICQCAADVLQEQVVDMLQRLLDGCWSFLNYATHFSFLSHRARRFSDSTGQNVWRKAVLPARSDLRSISSAIEHDTRNSHLRERSHFVKTGRLNLWTHNLLRIVPSSVSASYVRKQVNGSVIIVMLDSEMSYGKTGASNLDKSRIVHILLGLLTVGFSID